MKAKQKPSAKPPVVATLVRPPKRSLTRIILSEPLALGLIPLILVRPWLDGITYPTDNFYFDWITIALFVIWLARVLVRDEQIRFGIPMLLLGGFWATGLMTSFHTAQYDSTYRMLIIWAGHFFLFALAANILRTRTALAIALGAFFVSSLAETTWSLVHFKYVLAMVREEVLRDPALLKTYFPGADGVNAEVIHRLQVNRAFGSLLFPNALAAFLILGIPVTLGFGIQSIRGFIAQMRIWREAGRFPRSESPAYRPAWPLGVLLASGLIWLVLVAIGYILVSFVNPSPAPESAAFIGWDHGLVFFGILIRSFISVVLVILIPILIAFATGWTLTRYGLIIFGLSVRVWVLPPLLVLQLAALWLTYSRGGALALAAAVALMACFAFVVRRKKMRGKARLASSAATAALLALAISAVSLGAGAPPQPAQAVSQQPSQPAPIHPMPTPPVPPQAAAPSLAAPQQKLPITAQGEFLTAQDLMNPASFKLRMTYWRTGLRIALDNFFLGVGLGNFGTVYPKYQLPGAGDVTKAHNDYLQTLCETGILGFLFFCAFWGYFLVWGAKRLAREQDSRERWVLGGLYTGILAFLIHSLVDFDFFNPSLAFFAFLIAGIFYAWASLNEPRVKPVRRSPFAALGLMAAGTLIAAMAFQVYLSDYIIGGRNLVNVGNHLYLQQAFNAGEFFFRKLDNTNEPRQTPVIDIQSAGKLIGDRSVLESCGFLCVPAAATSRGYRQLRPNEPVPRNAFLVVTKPDKAREAAREYADLWLEEIGHADAIYPHNPELAAYFIQWYDLLSTSNVGDDARKRYTLEFLKWAEEGVKRSPEHFIYHEWYAKALWLRGNVETGSAKSTYFAKGLAEYKKAAELYPISVPTWKRYADALTKYGNALIKAGDKAQGEALVAESKKVFGYVRDLEQKLGQTT